MGDQFKLHGLEHGGGNLLDVFFVLGGNENLLDAGSMGRQYLFFEPTDWQYGSTQGYFTGHRQIVMHGYLHQRRHERSCHRDSGGRAIFGDRAFWHMNMDIEL